MEIKKETTRTRGTNEMKQITITPKQNIKEMKEYNLKRKNERGMK